MTFALIIKIVITIGIGAPYHYSISGDTRFAALEECRKVGVETANWLTQDGYVVTWECHQIGG